jgi:hypothetical protein
MPSTPGGSQSMIASEGASSRRKSLHASAPSVAAITSYPRSRSKACSLIRVPCSFSANNIFTIIVDHILWSARVCMLRNGSSVASVSPHCDGARFAFPRGSDNLRRCVPVRARNTQVPDQHRGGPRRVDRSMSNDPIQNAVEIASNADDGVVSRALFVTITRS